MPNALTGRVFKPAGPILAPMEVLMPPARENRIDARPGRSSAPTRTEPSSPCHAVSRVSVVAALAISAALLMAPAPASGQTALPAPEAFFGHPIGAEGKLARWDRIVEYMRLAAKSSERVLLLEPGPTTDGHPFLLLVVSSAENLRDLDRYRAINRRLFDPRTIASGEEGKALAAEGRVFVLITCSMHASEVGATQMSIEAVHRLVTDDSPDTRLILDNVVLLLVPCLNPDGQIMVTDWYRKTLGTPHENAPMPWLYHRYVGHDNNRDAYMLTQVESRYIAAIAFRDWLPQVWLDMHQMGSSGARIFVMPADDPINPNVDPLVYRNAGLLGYAQAGALEREGKTGITHGAQYTYWWEGAMGWAGWWHNQIGMLTELASVRTATSVEQRRADPSAPPPADTEGGRGERGGRSAEPGAPLPPPRDIQFRAQYPRPWLGGKWTLRDIVDYDRIAAFGLLDAAARMRSKLLEDLYAVGRRQIAAGRAGDPFAVVVPAKQADRPVAVKMLQTLALGGVEIHRARAAFRADGVDYPAGTWVILMAQPFRAYAKDMLEAQDYPRISPAPGVPARPPYDAAGWSLGMQMGVETVFVKAPFAAELERLETVPLEPGTAESGGPAWILDHAANNSLVAVNRLLEKGHRVSWLREAATVQGRSYAPGAIVVSGGSGLQAAIFGLARELGIDAVAAKPPGAPALRIRKPRTGLYQPWGGNMDEGWTRWTLEQHEFPFKTVHPEDLRKSGGAAAFDCLIFPDMGGGQILRGQTSESVPAEYRGGIEESGAKDLEAFVRKGGTVVAMGRSAELFMDRLKLPVRNALRGLGRDAFICPGSILRVKVDPEHPLAYGMRPDTDVYFSNSMAFEPVPSFADAAVSFAAIYPEKGLLRSGWLQGEERLAGRAAAVEIRCGRGRVVLLPIKVLNRAQAHSTFKLLFNAILTSAAEEE